MSRSFWLSDRGRKRARLAVAVHLVGVVMVVAAACGPDHHSPSVEGDRPPTEGPGHSASADAGILVSQARIIALPNGHGALYLTLDNHTSTDDRLLAVATPAAATADMHETTHEDGVMRMRPRPEGLDLPSRGRLRLEPGGRHVMLMGLTAPPDGQTVRVTLDFEISGQLAVDVPVEGTDGLSSAEGSHLH